MKKYSPIVMTRLKICLILIPVIMFSYVRICAQSYTIKNYAHFEVENESIIWQHVYDRSGFSLDSIKKLLYANVKKDNSLSVINEVDNELTITMTEKVFEKNGDKFSGRVIIQSKENKYRVLLSSISRNMGVKTLRMASAFGVSAQVKDYNGIRFEDDFINKAKDGLKNGNGSLKALDIYNHLFEKSFDYKSFESVSTSDW